MGYKPAMQFGGAALTTAWSARNEAYGISLPSTCILYEQMLIFLVGCIDWVLPIRYELVVRKAPPRAVLAAPPGGV